MSPEETREKAQEYRHRGSWHFQQARRAYTEARRLEAQAAKDEKSPPSMEERFARIFQ